jgi:tetratricopeptide (TPR) repeat protein
LTVFFSENYDSAIDNLKKVLNAYPDNFESLRMLTWLCHEKQRHEEAQGFAKKLHKLKPDDPQILLEIAQAMERSDLNTALDAYTRAAALFHKTEGSVSSVRIVFPFLVV